MIDELNWQPDAVICANDIMALGCIDAARKQLKLKVPKDISIVGFDGAVPASWQAYQLTTITQPLELMAQAAVDILMHRIENPSLPPEKRSFSGIFSSGMTL